MKHNITQLIGLRASLETESNQEHVKAEKLKKYQQTIQLESENPEDVKVKKQKSKLIKTMWNMMQRNKYGYMKRGAYFVLGSLGAISGVKAVRVIEIRADFYKGLDRTNLLDIHNKYKHHKSQETSILDKGIPNKVHELIYYEAIQNAIKGDTEDKIRKEVENKGLDKSLIDEFINIKVNKPKISLKQFIQSDNFLLTSAALSAITHLGTPILDQYANDLREKRIEQFTKAEEKLNG